MTMRMRKTRREKKAVRDFVKFLISSYCFVFFFFSNLQLEVAVKAFNFR